MITKNFDVIIIGGSYAGLSAALSLGRAIRKVLVIDSGKPCNRHTPHSHNFLTQDGKTPAAIAETGKEQVLQYPTVQFMDAGVTEVKREKEQFLVSTSSHQDLTAKKLLFASGVKDLMPNIESFDDCWGISAIHCPYCHGYEYKGQKTGLLANGDIAFEFSQLLHNWTDQLTIFTNGPSTITAAQADQLALKNIFIVEKKIRKFQHLKGYIQSMNFNDGSTFQLDAIYAKLPFEQHCLIPEHLGCEINEQGYIQIDEFQRTSIPGIYAAGDNTTSMRSVASAVAAGTKAGAFINHDLISGK
ncbi:NAD(P)/FAD-dependent oxidoreductase [Pedobacter nutrimenti]|uniref:NAD(P)/FAD-dependent oxidoreductase n=1 Tax=Pedobacter nutrimenti TaxID=1241337 RepID=UPI0029314053|nr:NAD(P)/FAD-dependent oxidoreductase [Pedobacter nutrimenti]